MLHILILPAERVNVRVHRGVDDCPSIDTNSHSGALERPQAYAEYRKLHSYPSGGALHGYANRAESRVCRYLWADRGTL